MQYRFGSLLLSVLAAGVLTLTGCSKPSELGLSLVETNPSDVFYTDTLSLELSTELTEPLLTYERSRWICGAYVDPIFGQTSTSIYTNFRLTSTNATFPSATLDSLVLSLEYDSIGHYGANSAEWGTQTWEVWRLEQSIDQDADYYSDDQFQLGDLLATQSFVPALRDSVTVQGVVRRPHLRIRLDDALGQKLINPDSAIYENNTIFKSFLKGVCIRPKPGTSNDAVIRFLPNASLTKMTLYYRDSSGTARTFDYLADDDAESTLNISHDYVGTRILQSTNQDTFVYLQGLNGVNVRLAFPHVANLGKIIVNKAELYVYAVGEENRNYPIPDQLFCLEKTSAGEYLLVDDITTSITRNSLNPYLQFGGTLKYDGSTRYFRMNLSQFFQRLVDNETDEKAVYIQTASVTDTERMLLGNERSGNFKAKLYLTYTKTN